MGPEFFQTSMGHRFYEATMPALVRAIEKNTKAMLRLAAAIEKQNGTEVPAEPEPEKGEDSP